MSREAKGTESENPRNHRKLVLPPGRLSNNGLVKNQVGMSSNRRSALLELINFSSPKFSQLESEGNNTTA